MTVAQLNNKIFLFGGQIKACRKIDREECQALRSSNATMRIHATIVPHFSQYNTTHVKQLKQYILPLICAGRKSYPRVRI
ncbi:MAG TPA: hypothetical protein VEL70_09370 [Candidatus Acidoferrum sp.]|nr:hypothetical protein [Candidatus Acidoferrum sp.]